MDDELNLTPTGAPLGPRGISRISRVESFLQRRNKNFFSTSQSIRSNSGAFARAETGKDLNFADDFSDTNTSLSHFGEENDEKLTEERDKDLPKDGDREDGSRQDGSQGEEGEGGARSGLSFNDKRISASSLLRKNSLANRRNNSFKALNDGSNDGRKSVAVANAMSPLATKRHMHVSDLPSPLASSKSLSSSKSPREQPQLRLQSQPQQQTETRNDEPRAPYSDDHMTPCGMCGACGTMPPWAPELMERLAKERQNEILLTMQDKMEKERLRKSIHRETTRGPQIIPNETELAASAEKDKIISPAEAAGAVLKPGPPDGVPVEMKSRTRRLLERNVVRTQSFQQISALGQNTQETQPANTEDGDQWGDRVLRARQFRRIQTSRLLQNATDSEQLEIYKLARKKTSLALPGLDPGTTTTATSTTETKCNALMNNKSKQHILNDLSDVEIISSDESGEKLSKQVETLTLTRTRSRKRKGNMNRTRSSKKKCACDETGSCTRCRALVRKVLDLERQVIDLRHDKNLLTFELQDHAQNSTRWFFGGKKYERLQPFEKGSKEEMLLEEIQALREINDMFHQELTKVEDERNVMRKNIDNLTKKLKDCERRNLQLMSDNKSHRNVDADETYLEKTQAKSTVDTGKQMDSSHKSDNKNMYNDDDDEIYLEEETPKSITSYAKQKATTEMNHPQAVRGSPTNSALEAAEIAGEEEKTTNNIPEISMDSLEISQLEGTVVNIKDPNLVAIRGKKSTSKTRESEILSRSSSSASDFSNSSAYTSVSLDNSSVVEEDSVTHNLALSVPSSPEL